MRVGEGAEDLSGGDAVCGRHLWLFLRREFSEGVEEIQRRRMDLGSCLRQALPQWRRLELMKK